MLSASVPNLSLFCNYEPQQLIVTTNRCFHIVQISHTPTKNILSVIGDPAETDYTAVGCAVTTISSNLTEMSKGVKLLAALMEDEGGNGQQLLGAARNLACAVSDMLKTAQPASAEVPHSVSQCSNTQARHHHTYCKHECVFHSLARTSYRLQVMWARPAESCCSR